MFGLLEKLGFQYSKPEPRSYQNRFRNISAILILYPFEETYFRIARYTLQRLFQSQEKYRYFLLTSPQFTDRDLFIETTRREIKIRPGQKDRDLLQDELLKFHPDLLLQLEPSPGRELSRFLDSTKINLKMGFGKDPSGIDLFLSRKEHSFYERDLLNLIQLLLRES